MLKELAKNYYKNLYSLPPNHTDLELFAQHVLEMFVEKLHENKQTVVWNYGCDSVVFEDKIDEIKESFLEHENNKGDSDVADGTGISRDSEKNKYVHEDNKLTGGKAVLQERYKEEDEQVNRSEENNRE